MKSSKWVCHMVIWLCFVLTITSSMGNNRSLNKEGIELIMCPPSCRLCFIQVFLCRMWHVSGVIFVVKCFVFFLLPYSISCVFTVSFIHIRYFSVHVWLLVMYHWLSVPNNGKSALFTLSPVYACTSHVQEPLYCFWCVSSFLTVTETGF